MRFSNLCVIAGAVVALNSGALANQLACTSHDDLAKVLGTKYKETLVNYGIGAKKNLVEIFVSPKGTFTILQTYPNGVSCIIAAGENWENGQMPKEVTSL